MCEGCNFADVERVDERWRPYQNDPRLGSRTGRRCPDCDRNVWRRCDDNPAAPAYGIDDFPSNRYARKRWPKSVIVWTSVTTDIIVVKTGERWGLGDVHRVIEQTSASHLYTQPDALVEALRRELFAEHYARRKGTNHGRP